MPWTPQGGGGGPWGGGNNSGGGGRSPWGRGGSGGGGGGGGGGGPQPPDLEELLRRGQQRFRRVLPGGGGGSGRLALFVVLLALAAWGLTGFYRVAPDEQGIVLRFGEWVETTGPGLHYRPPYPIGEVITPKVTTINREEIGFREVGAGIRDVSEESLMLTGDENIVDIDFSIFWRIKDAGQYLFNLRDPRGTVRVAGESVMRDIIGQTPIQSALTEGRGVIEQRAREKLQGLLDEYGAGVQITRVQLLKVDPPEPVIDAFNDVQRAKADQERLRNEAEAYRNDIIPRARGEAERLLQEAQAYKEEIVNIAQGDASRFQQVYEAYAQAKDVTARRLYLETMEQVLRRAQKVIIDPTAEGTGVVPYLPLPELRRNQPTATPAAAGEGGAR